MIELNGRERPYFKKLRHYFEEGIKANAAPGLREPADIERVLPLLQCPEFPLLEKANIFLLYKEWSSKRNLLDAVTVIADECRNYISGTGEQGRYQRTLHHFKADLLAQLYRET